MEVSKIMKFLSKDKEKLDINKAKYVEIYERLLEKATFSLVFKDNVHIDYELTNDWVSVIKDISKGGEISFRNFFKGVEYVGNEKRKVKSAHVFFSEGASFEKHYHEGADKLIYLVKGKLEILIHKPYLRDLSIIDGHKYFEVDKMVFQKYTVVADKNLPFKINKRISHIITAVEESALVFKFVI